jgi:hypothetical protein
MSERSMGVLQQADEERARRKDNPEPIGRDVLERLGEPNQIGTVAALVRRADLRALLTAYEAQERESKRLTSVSIEVLRERNVLAAKVEAQEKKYKLLQDAVNENDSPCLSTCDSYAHAEDCSHVDMAKALERQQERIEAQAKRLEELVADRDAWHGCAVEQAKQIERLRDALEEIGQRADHGIPFYAYGDNEAGCEFSTRLSWISSRAGQVLREEEGRDGTA